MQHECELVPLMWLGCLTNARHDFFALFESVVYDAKYDGALKAATLEGKTALEFTEEDETINEKWKATPAEGAEKGDEEPELATAEPAQTLGFKVAVQHFKDTFNPAKLSGLLRDLEAEAEAAAKLLVDIGCCLLEGNKSRKEIVASIKACTFDKKQGSSKMKVLVVSDVNSAPKKLHRCKR